MTVVLVPVAIGELIDKITILQIKAERIGDVAKRGNVLRELQALVASRETVRCDQAVLRRLERDLAGTNAALWDIEDRIRACELAGDFGPSFVELARSVYKLNDRRAAIKRRISDVAGSLIVEEKSYATE